MPRSILLVNPSEVYNTYIKGKTLVYLDTNIWIDLTEKKTALAKEAVDLCKQLVAGNTHLFPVSYPVLEEARKQPLPQREQQGQLMDVLSRGVSLRYREEVYKIEIENMSSAFFLNESKKMDREQVFTRAISYLGDSSLTIPDELCDFS